MPPSDPYAPTVAAPSVTSETRVSLAIVISIILAAIAVGGAVARGEQTSGRVDRLEVRVDSEQRESRNDISELKGDVKVLNSNMELMLRRWGVQPVRSGDQ